MKVLFAVNNENISESIIKRYQQDYKEIISAKNVYYFNAIIKELQRDKNYDRIVISEDLEPFSNNNYDAIDKFIFEKMDSISDEATNMSGNDISIILICSDRREKSEPLLVKLFGIGVYNALLGKDRSITTVCELLNRPRSKKEAKLYYRIDSEDVDYKSESEGDVSEVEIQNILSHYKKLGRNEEKYVESFDHIASQYTDSQLRVIAKFLPLNVKAVLEANSPKYQEVVSFAGSNGSQKVKKQEVKYNDYKKSAKPKKQKNNQEEVNLDIIQNNLNQNRIKDPVIIPSAVNTANVRKLTKVEQPKQVKQQEPVEYQKQQEKPVLQPVEEQGIDDVLNGITENANDKANPIIEGFEDMDFMENLNNLENTNNIEPMEEGVLTTQPKRRGRPKKVQPQVIENNMQEDAIQPVKRGRGRPKKVQAQENFENGNQVTMSEQSMDQNQAPTQTAPVNLFELGEDDTTATQTNTSTTYSDMILPGLDDEEMYLIEEQNNLQQTQNNESINNDVTEEMINNDLAEEMIQNENNFAQEQPNYANNNQYNNYNEPVNTVPNFETASNQSLQNTGKYNLTNTDLSNLITSDKKIVAFVGTTKNGTSFLVNSLAAMFSQKGIKTALLDLTQNRNSYYIYTENEEALRQQAYGSIASLKNGEPKGIQTNKNLTVFTALPGEDEDVNDYANILETLVKTYSVILLDCDFETNYGYFKEAQEIYLVQSLDVLTIQPLTAFLRDLKAKDVLNPEKIRIALNKVVKVRTLSEKTIIGGMAYYNDPSMSYMTELFNRDIVPYCSIPFDEQAYSKYLEGLVNCKISINGYSKELMVALTKLSNMVYPLIVSGGNNKQNVNPTNNRYTPPSVNQTGSFPQSMNDTLNKMKNNY